MVALYALLVLQTLTLWFLFWLLKLGLLIHKKCAAMWDLPRRKWVASRGVIVSEVIV